MSITATVQNDTICLPKGTHFPDGTQVIVEPLGLSNDHDDVFLCERLSKFVGIADDLPSDLAQNLDQYIHAHPRKQ